MFLASLLYTGNWNMEMDKSRPHKNKVADREWSLQSLPWHLKVATKFRPNLLFADHHIIPNSSDTFSSDSLNGKHSLISASCWNQPALVIGLYYLSAVLAFGWWNLNSPSASRRFWWWLMLRSYFSVKSKKLQLPIGLHHESAFLLYRSRTLIRNEKLLTIW